MQIAITLPPSELTKDDAKTPYPGWIEWVRVPGVRLAIHSLKELRITYANNKQNSDRGTGKHCPVLARQPGASPIQTGRRRWHRGLAQGALNDDEANLFPRGRGRP